MLGRESVPVLARLLVRKGADEAAPLLDAADRAAREADVLEWLVPTGLAYLSGRGCAAPPIAHARAGAGRGLGPRCCGPGPTAPVLPTSAASCCAGCAASASRSRPSRAAHPSSRRGSTATGTRPPPSGERIGDPYERAPGAAGVEYAGADAGGPRGARRPRCPARCSAGPARLRSWASPRSRAARGGHADEPGRPDRAAGRDPATAGVGDDQCRDRGTAGGVGADRGPPCVGGAAEAGVATRREAAAAVATFGLG
jgi:hypothetical protein